MRQYKVCLLGDFAVGKTSLVRRFVEGRFDDRYLSTIGVKISRRSIDLGSGQINLIMWDLAGGEDFSGVQISYLGGASGALVVCDLTRSGTLQQLPDYARQFVTINPSAPVVYLGNKSDLDEQRAITETDLQSACRQVEGPYLLTSAKTGEMVEDAIITLARLIVKTK